MGAATLLDRFYVLTTQKKDGSIAASVCLFQPTAVTREY